MLSNEQSIAAKNELIDFLHCHYGKTIGNATDMQLYLALSNIAKRFMYRNRGKVFSDQNRVKKVVHYMSIEFLIGRILRNNLWNLGLEDKYRALLQENGRNIEDIYELEHDAGLGNGGLGRLAASYLDSLATLGYKSVGHTIKYEYGLFKQRIVDGKQVEELDSWLDTGNVWLERREDRVVEVKIGGTLIQHYDEKRGLSYETQDETRIYAVPYDLLITGYDSSTASTLRLWEARAETNLDIRLYCLGEYESALRTATLVSEINKILYPDDNHENGKNLRLLQEYFLVSASMQSVLNDYFSIHQTLKDLPNMMAVHINDTHAALCIAEIQRLLIDEYNYGWDEAWNAVKQMFSYTNHTILAEANEVHSLARIEKYMPRIALILKEMDRRFRIELADFFKNDNKKVESMAIISGQNVYMANLSIYASHDVNGVAQIHSQIIKTRLFKDFDVLYPTKFKNITNGITHRRWLCQCNPGLNELIVSLIGDGFYKDSFQLEKLKQYENDEAVLNKLAEVKFENKKKLAQYIYKTQGVVVDPNARFDVQIKRIHEYKRQLMNVLKIIYLMNEIRENPEEEVTPQVFIFAGKAAYGYQVAKRIIELIVKLSKEIDEDPVLKGKLQVVFLENYNVSMAEVIMPATEVSEQISLAGREASGTGNMKAVINGALMLCTIDGANIEICDECGHENMFEFGLTAEEVEKIKTRGYNAMEYYIASDKIRKVIDTLKAGLGGESFGDIVDYILGRSSRRDLYLCLADFESYLEAHYKMDKAYKDKIEWNKKALHSIASMGFFSSDRSIDEYIQKIWKLTKNDK